MAGSRCNTCLETARVQRVIKEFFAKSLHIILEARRTCDFPGSCCGCDGSARDNSFNLTLKECPSVLQNPNFWLQGDQDFLAVDVILTRKPADPGLVCPPSDACFIKGFSKSEKIVERWIVHYEPEKHSGVQGKRSGGRGTSWHRSSISLLRSLYAMLRILPTHKLFRDLKSSARRHFLKLSHRISPFVEPFTHSEDSEMRRFGFCPVDTPHGQLCLSVSYLPKFECNSTIPLSAVLVTDYFASPSTAPEKISEPLPTGTTVCHDVHLPPSPSPETTKCPRGRDLKLKQPKIPKSWNLLTEMNLRKAFSLGRRHEIGLKLVYSCLPRAPSSTGSGTCSSPDEWDAFDLPFLSVINGDDDIMRTEISSGKEDFGKSWVSVGVLTQMLKTAPPLRQGTSESESSSSVGGAGNTCISSSPRLLKPKGVDDALLELRNYREMVGLLRHSKSSGWGQT